MGFFGDLGHTIVVIQVYVRSGHVWPDIWAADGVDICVTTAVGLNLSYLLLFTTFVVSDLWKRPVPARVGSPVPGESRWRRAGIVASSCGASITRRQTSIAEVASEPRIAATRAASRED